MGLKISKKTAEAHISTESKEGGSVVESKQTTEPAGTFVVPEAHAVVGMTMGMTKNLGNFEAFKVSVSLHVPCGPTVSEIEQSAEEVYQWIDHRISQILEEVEGDIVER